MRWGIIARADTGSGLQTQTTNLVKMLRPDKVLIIDSTSFNGRKQDFGLYDGFNTIISDGFIDDITVDKFLEGLDAVLSCELFYSGYLVSQAHQLSIKTYLQANWEFLDNLNQPFLLEPTKFLMPSYWQIDEMVELFGQDKVVYLPPPLFLNDFKDNLAENNRDRLQRRFLHIVGHRAVHDRNGTKDLLEALAYCQSDFELVIHSQEPLDDEIDDYRITYSYGNIKDNTKLYNGYDAMILPRRYGGLCLPVNEALASGMPVIMTDISPNNQLLPKQWLVNAKKLFDFETRTTIDCYGVDINKLARKIDQFAESDNDWLKDQQIMAFDIAYNQFNADNLIDRYNAL